MTLPPTATPPVRDRCPRRTHVAALGVASMLGVAGLAPVAATADRATVSPQASDDGQHLDLGPAGLPESRTTTTLQPGVTLTRISRGSTDARLFWTDEVLIPSTSTSPDPDAPPRSISDRASAEAIADRLRSKGFTPRIEQVDQPATADVPAGVLGYRVRVGHFSSKDEAEAEKARLASAGEQASSVYTGWDGDPGDRGPWHVNVLTIDPRTFGGSLTGSYGPDIERRETTSQLARLGAATAAVNAGFFVLDPASGAEGDPAGAGVYDGDVLSEAVDGRPTLLLHADARHSRVVRLTWDGVALAEGRKLTLDGVDRVPGTIRNCGGDATDEPTAAPLHDVTCTDGDELLAFTPEFADRGTPAGEGREVVVEDHEVVAVHDARGTELEPGQTSVQAIGTMSRRLGGLQVGDPLRLRLRLMAGGSPLATPPGTTVTNGGPLLLRGGHEEITQRRDGFVHPGDPSFAYGWFVKRNPRTFAGVDSRGRTVLVTVDGRSTDDLGLSAPEMADVARSLGLVDAINLDGGGSTTMVVDGQVISHPSDTTGERPVGDALLVAP